MNQPERNRVMKTKSLLLLTLVAFATTATAQQWTTNNLPAGLIAWWQAEGNMLDTAGGHHGSGDAAPTYAPGRFGQAFQFNGNSQSVSIPDSHADLDNWTQFTLEAWVWLDNTNDGTGGGQAILSKVGDGRQPGPDLGYQFGFGQGATKLFCQFNSSGQPWPGNQTIAVLSEPAPTNTWLHVAATYDHDAVKIYFNGVCLVTNVIGPVTIVNSDASLRLNSDDNENVYFAGRMDDARIYNRALSESEIAYLFNGPPAPPATAAFIDSFTVGPQSHALGAGDSYWGETVSDLDPAQVLGGGRRLTLLADEDAAFRTLEEGSFSAVLSGSIPGSLSIQAVVVNPPEASTYEPAVLLDYDCPSADWSGFDRMVVRFATPPTADVAVQTSLNSGGDPFWADTLVPAGSQSATILFSELNGSVPVSLGAVTSLRLQWTLPAMASLTLRDIQVTGAGAPARPRLSVSLNSGVTLSWPTNAPGFFLESTTNLATSFTTVTNEPVVAGTYYTVTLPATQPVEFFRLHKP
jgi:hypothetical protein